MPSDVLHLDADLLAAESLVEPLGRVALQYPNAHGLVSLFPQPGDDKLHEAPADPAPLVLTQQVDGVELAIVDDAGVSRDSGADAHPVSSTNLSSTPAQNSFAAMFASCDGSLSCCMIRAVLPLGLTSLVNISEDPSTALLRHVWRLSVPLVLGCVAMALLTSGSAAANATHFTSASCMSVFEVLLTLIWKVPSGCWPGRRLPLRCSYATVIPCAHQPGLSMGGRIRASSSFTFCAMRA